MLDTRFERRKLAALLRKQSVDLPTRVAILSRLSTAMMRCTILAVLLVAGPAAARDARPTDDEVRQRIIAESISGYLGNCPCPFNTMRNGHRCGGRSAYSRPGGRAPICFADDVTDAMVARWRRAHGERL